MDDSVIEHMNTEQLFWPHEKIYIKKKIERFGTEKLLSVNDPSDYKIVKESRTGFKLKTPTTVKGSREYFIAPEEVDYTGTSMNPVEERVWQIW